jgi:dipeptidase E
MNTLNPKLFLYSLALSPVQAGHLTRLIGKEPAEITFALIENAADVIPNSSEWLGGFRMMLESNGYQLERFDLRDWKNKKEQLRQQLLSKDVIWLGGGNTFYLRWILKHTGVDKVIQDFVNNGKVYAGWSAGAVVAGPTLKYFESMDDTGQSPEMIFDGMHLTNTVVVPHLDNKEFAEDALMTNCNLLHDGYQTITLRDNQVLLIDGGKFQVI